MTRFLLAILSLMLFLPAASDAQLSVQGGLGREFVMQAGEFYEGSLQIYNSSDEMLQGRAYQTDYAFFADGTNQFPESNTLPRSNAAWIHFAPEEFSAPPREYTLINYTVQVPTDDALTGSYWSVIMIEPVTGLPSSDSESEEQVLLVNAIIRHAIQFVVTVGETGEKAIALNGSLRSNQDNLPLLQVELENTGQVWLRPDCWAEFYSDKGELLDRLESAPIRVYPGCSVSHKFDLSYPNGDYYALVVIDNGDGKVWGAQYNLSLR